MSKKSKWILIIAGSLVLAGLVTWGIVSWVFKPTSLMIPLRVAVTFPEEGGSIEVFRPELLAGVKTSSGLYVHETLIPDDKYIPYIDEHIGDGFYGDLYYTVNNNRIGTWKNDNLLNPVITTQAPEVIPALLTLQQNSGGEAVFLPVSWYSWGFYYRKSVLENLEIDLPETWQEFLDASELIKQQSLIPVAMVSRQRWPSLIWIDYLNIRMYGAEYQRSWQKLEIPFTDERNAAVFTEFRSLIESGVIVVDQDSDSWTAQLDSVDNREAVFVLSGSFLYSRADYEFREDLGWMPFPEMDSSVPDAEVVSSSGFIQSAQAPKPENVSLFTDYALSDEYQNLLNNLDNSLFPVRLDNALALDRDDAAGAVEALGKAASAVGTSARMAHPAIIVPLKAVLGEYLTGKIQEDDQEQVLRKLEEERQRILDRQ